MTFTFSLTRVKILKPILFVTSLLVSFAVFAQEKVEISIGKKSNWYEQPWAWVVGAAVFILLLVAILRSGKKS
jgi:hypothetical protein